MDKFIIVKPTVEDKIGVFQFWDQTIPLAYQAEGLGEFQTEIICDIEKKKDLFNKYLENQDSIIFLIAKNEEQILGTVSFGPSNDDIKKCTGNALSDMGEIGTIYVLPKYFGQGIASSLITEMAELLLKQGIEEFCLDCGFKTAQKKWLSKFGAPYVIARDYWGKGEDHYVWRCKVNEYINKSK